MYLLVLLFELSLSLLTQFPIVTMVVVHTLWLISEGCLILTLSTLLQQKVADLAMGRWLLFVGSCEWSMVIVALKSLNLDLNLFFFFFLVCLINLLFVSFWKSFVFDWVFWYFLDCQMWSIHLVQSNEGYKNKNVYYCLGDRVLAENFIVKYLLYDVW